MTALMSKHSRESFREFLEKGCNCSYVGEALPMPYDGDGPDIFRAPSGKEFCVPQPLGSLYEQYVIDKIMEVHKIEILNSVYVAIHAMTQDIANIEGSEEKIETPHAANE